MNENLWILNVTRECARESENLSEKQLNTGEKERRERKKGTVSIPEKREHTKDRQIDVERRRIYGREYKRWDWQRETEKDLR